ncbi:MAG: NfeD family protein [Clostridia bacterium]|nr:NfeD family protein [Clostridia bacterium]
MLAVWLTVIVLACLVEGITQFQLVSIWAVFGGLAALICDLCGLDKTVQIVVFFVVTILLLVLTIPLVKKLRQFKKTPTNADMYIGKKGKVTKIINSDEGLFQVRVDNCEWSAITGDRTLLPLGTEISVESIEGVKLIVSPTQQTANAK